MFRIILLTGFCCAATVTHAEQYVLEMEFFAFDGPLPKAADALLTAKLESLTTDQRRLREVDHTIAVLKQHRNLIETSRFTVPLVQDKTAIHRCESNSLLLETRVTLENATDQRCDVKMALGISYVAFGNGLVHVSPGTVDMMRLDSPEIAARTATDRLMFLVKNTIKKSDNVESEFPNGYEQEFIRRLPLRIGQQANITTASTQAAVAGRVAK